MQTVLCTPTFDKHAKASGLSESELKDMIDYIAADPKGGELIRGTGGARKIRFATSGGGKSGGYRTFHYFAGTDVPIFLLALIDKSISENLTKAERNALSVLLSQIVQEYRKPVSTIIPIPKRALPEMPKLESPRHVPLRKGTN